MSGNDNNTTEKKEKGGHKKLFHIVRRKGIKPVHGLGIRVASLVLAFVFCGIVTYLLTGDDPVKVYMTIIDGAFGTNRRIWSMLQNIAVLMCLSLAVTPAFMMKFWNIGAEGQALIGGLAAAAVMLFLGDSLSSPALITMMFFASILAGATWALIPALFRAFFNTNETLFTLMMNYIAIQIVSFFVYVNSVPKGSGQIGVINLETKNGWFPQIAGIDYLLNVIIALVLTLAVFFYLRRSKHGFDISVVGESVNTARYLGINVKKVIIRTMILSGALCGVAGLILVGGASHTISTETVGGKGFTAIMVSWLGKFNPIVMIGYAFLIAFMEKGSIEVSTRFGLNDSFSSILTGIIIFFIIGSEFFLNYKIILNHNKKKEES